MCTAATFLKEDFYFGRTLDYENSYGEDITITPRNYPFHFQSIGKSLDTHYAMIGVAHIADDYPLYYEAVNEHALGMAGLNFVGNAVYNDWKEGKDNIAQYEFIPWILGQCASVAEAKQLLEKINLVNSPFSENYPIAQLHWMIADREECITVESVESGLKIYNNPTGVLTNNPSFDEQLFQLNNYMNLSPKPPQNHFCKNLPLQQYSRGMGALGLPGDLSSQSRFVRAAFVRLNSLCGTSERECVSQFFHILGSVEQQRGCCYVGDGNYEYTIYTSCCNANKGIFYYTSYDNHQISAVDMNRENLDGTKIIFYEMIKEGEIKFQN
ncbi:MAG: choloylglycine hydrolase [Lachnospiraceae bacterium]|nr:choloylglycine hydrolase [Lachnospiraceae bacterium]